MTGYGGTAFSQRLCTTVERQIKRSRSAIELLLPICYFWSDTLAFKDPTLPACIVGVLNGKRRKGGRMVVHDRFIAKRHLPQEQDLGPSITDDMMHRYQ